MLEMSIAMNLLILFITLIVDVGWVLHRYSVLTEASANLSRTISVFFNARRGGGMDCNQLACQAREILTNWQATQPLTQNFVFTPTAVPRQLPLNPYPLIEIDASWQSSCLFCALFQFQPNLRTRSTLTIEKDDTACVVGAGPVSC